MPAAPSARAEPRHADERVLPVAARLPPVRVRVRVGARLRLRLRVRVRLRLRLRVRVPVVALPLPLTLTLPLTTASPSPSSPPPPSASVWDEMLERYREDIVEMREREDIVEIQVRSSGDTGGYSGDTQWRYKGETGEISPPSALVWHSASC